MINIERFAGRQANVDSYLLSHANSLIVVDLLSWPPFRDPKRVPERV
jgi:hypothetical protein